MLVVWCGGKRTVLNTTLVAEAASTSALDKIAISQLALDNVTARRAILPFILTSKLYQSVSVFLLKRILFTSLVFVPLDLALDTSGGLTQRTRNLELVREAMDGGILDPVERIGTRRLCAVTDARKILALENEILEGGMGNTSASEQGETALRINTLPTGGTGYRVGLRLGGRKGDMLAKTWLAKRMTAVGDEADGRQD